MEKNLSVFLFLSISLQLAVAIKHKSCSVHSLGDCPENSNCNQFDLMSGDCTCKEGWDMNEHYKGPTDDYCVKSTRTTFSPNHVPSDADNRSSDITSKTIVNIQPPPSSHHLIAGILISMSLVILVLGAAYGVKKMHPVRRLREYIITRRRSRPLYADVTLSQEIDDPPLI